MVKIIGIILIASSILALIFGAIVDINYGSHSQISGNVVNNIIAQPSIPMWSYDYVSGLAMAYSIISLIAGIIFLFRV